jgi:alkylation response protein AidB-like acyl-CoA dehydrogenase
MPIGISEEHEELQRTARRWVEQHCPPSVPRARLDAETELLPEFWGDLSELGWLGMHIREELGGIGYGLPELVVVLEELGRAAAPGPFVPTVTAAALVQAGGNEAAGKSLLPALCTGEAIGAVAFTGALVAERVGGGLRVSGTLRPVLSGALATHIVARATTADGAETWVVLGPDDFVATELPTLDPVRRVASIEVAGSVVASDRELPELTTRVAVDTAVVLFGAESVGVAQWCVDTAADYAKVRVQFGRPIGQFQGVKHRCADMLARTELARAAVWDAARGDDDPEIASLTAAVAGALTSDSSLQTGKDCIQTLGGIGFTWEHDAHFYMKRVAVIRQLLGVSSMWRVRVAQLTEGGTRRRLAVDLPPEAEEYRGELHAFLETVKPLEGKAQRVALAEAGYITPHWPAPWGIDADALQQLVIEDEFRKAKVVRPTIAVGAWALPNLIVYGTAEQRERWILPTLKGDITWCQLFSEPGAGSDLASLTTRAEKIEGGFLLNGQKVWTSMAQTSEWGILLARTDPDKPKHDGISCFMLDMSLPGIDIRPLREITGQAWFNEVFFDDVFIPDDCLVGDMNDGWRAARTTLANERVFMGGGSSMGAGVDGVLKIIREQGLTDDRIVLDEIGAIAADAHALSVLGFRLTLKALAGANPSGSEASVRKLLGVQNDQRVQEVGLSLLGPEGATTEGASERWTHGFLFNQNLTIAGGTSQIQRNVIAERLLGLPRDP